MRLLAISGSLRARSSNTELLRAVVALAAPGEVVFFTGLDALPHFNPDLDVEGVPLPAAAADLRAQVAAADGLLVSSPEYAHGVPGSLKNLFDWLVSDPELYEKPVGLLNASPSSKFAHPALEETLRTMSMTVVVRAVIDVPLDRRGLVAADMAADPRVASLLGDALAGMREAVARYRAAHPRRERPT